MSQTKSQLIGNVSGGANFSGIVTASAFSGDGSSLTGVGIGTDGSVNTIGIITATAFFGDGSGLTNVSVPEILTFSPLDGSTNNSTGSTITLVFNQGIAKGVGNITLRNGSSSGTIIETINVTSSKVSISGSQLTITPDFPLPISTDIYVVISSGAIITATGTNYDGISTYNFSTSDDQVLTYSPANNATNISYESSIVLTFPYEPVRGTGVVELRRGTVSGTIVETYDATTSNRISISGNQWILDPTNVLSSGETYFVIIPSTAIIDYPGLNIGGGTKSYSFTVVSITQVSFSPVIDATEVPLNSNIVLTFDNTPERGTGTIELRRDSASGDIIETYDAASSDRISIVGNQWILNPLDTLLAGKNVFLIVPNTAIASFPGLTIGGGTVPYGFTFIDQFSFTWGVNQVGQLGQNNTTQYSSPVQIPGTTWSSIESGNLHSLALQTSS